MSDKLNETTETPETTDAAEPTDASESATTPGAAANVTSTAGVASASEQPDASASELSTTARPRRKARDGFVVSNSMDKTVVVAVIERVRHPKYNKFVLQTKRLYAHDETNDVNVGDKVRVMETRPLSKQKRWRVSE